MRRLSLLVLLLGACGGGNAGTSACTLGGRWQGFVHGGRWAGETEVQYFLPDGVFHLDVESAHFSGTWSVDNDVLELADTTCVTADPGHYQLAWYDSCETVIYQTLDDPCDSRGESLNGTTFTHPF